jgi:serine/threonine-protein kinase
MLGANILNYKITEKIGAGGQGEVYKALDTKLGRNVVIKTLPPELTAKEANLKRFKREAQLASSLDHPNICTIFDLNESNGIHFIAMQYVEGRNVRQLVNGRPLELKSALRIAVQTADALAAAHARDIIHRDIKANNVMVTDSGQVKILDFGLAKLTDEGQDRAEKLGIHQTDLTEVGIPYGTATYAAPEQARGDRVDHRADIFSTGVLLYEMLTGTWPFHGKNAVEVRYAVMKEAAQPVEQRRGEPIPPRLQQIIDKAMAKEPGQRYQRIAEFRDEVADVLREVAGGAGADAQMLDSLSSQAPRHLGGDTGGLLSRASRWFRNITGSGKTDVPTGSPRSGGLASSSVSATAAPVAPAADEALVTSVGDKEKKSIAILPFKNLSRDEASNFYEFSLADTVITELAQLKSLVVRPSSAIAKYQGLERDPRDAGRELNVDAVLSAGFLRAGERLRVTAQLLNVRSGDMIWSDRIDAEAEDIIAVQDTIARHILQGLKLELSPDEVEVLEQRATDNAEAYTEFLRGRDAMGRFVYHSLASEDVEAAIAHFKRAVELDPQFARAYCALGGCYANLIIKCIGDQDDYTYAKEYLDKGLQLEPNNVEARMHMVFLNLTRGKKARARQLISRLRYEAPNDVGVHFTSSYLYRLDGKYEKSLRGLERMLRLNPNERVVVSYNRARIYMYQGRMEEALTELQAGAKVEPDHPLIRTFIAVWHLRSGDAAQAAAMLKEVLAKTPDMDGIRPYYAMALAALGDEAGARAQLTERVEEVAATDHDAPYWLATAYVMLGEDEKAFNWLEKAVSLGNENLPWFKINPLWARLQNHPRLLELLGQIEERREKREGRA